MSNYHVLFLLSYFDQENVDFKIVLLLKLPFLDNYLRTELFKESYQLLVDYWICSFFFYQLLTNQLIVSKNFNFQYQLLILTLKILSSNWIFDVHSTYCSCVRVWVDQISIWYCKIFWDFLSNFICCLINFNFQLFCCSFCYSLWVFKRFMKMLRLIFYNLCFTFPYFFQYHPKGPNL